MNKLAAVLAGVWLGLQLGIGYVAVPVLFQHMGKMEAGAMAGSVSSPIDTMAGMAVGTVRLHQALGGVVAAGVLMSTARGGMATRAVHDDR